MLGYHATNDWLEGTSANFNFPPPYSATHHPTQHKERDLLSFLETA